MMPKQDQYNNFWHGIPGAMFGSAVPFGSGKTSHVVVEPSKMFEAIGYFAEHGVKISNIRQHTHYGHGISFDYVLKVKAA